jgi:hypothetical protein
VASVRKIKKSQPISFQKDVSPIPYHDDMLEHKFAIVSAAMKIQDYKVNLHKTPVISATDSRYFSIADMRIIPLKSC